MADFCIIGRHGLLGSALTRRLGDATSYPTPDTKVVLDFGSYVHPYFEENPHYQMQQVLNRCATLLPYCYERKILYVFPSSALVYEKDTQFARFKKTLEQFASCFDPFTLGLRIFPVYGPGENRTVVSQWCRAMLNGERPVVYGDGQQSRDFIYVDDVVDQILSLVEKEVRGVVDIGTGTPTKFADIIHAINFELGTYLEPIYVPQPAGYSEGIVCKNPMPTKVSIQEGIQKVLAILTRKSSVAFA